MIDRSEHGLRLRGSFSLKRRRVVELDFLTLRCRIKRVDIGEPGLEMFDSGCARRFTRFRVKVSPDCDVRIRWAGVNSSVCGGGS